MKSFFCRLISVRETFFNEKNFDTVTFNHTINSEDKLRIVLNIDISNLFFVLNFGHILKRKNFSYLLDIYELYNISFTTLLNFCCDPIIEKRLGKMHFVFKPFRENKDFFFLVKNLSFEYFTHFWSLNLDVSDFLTSESKFWLLKHFPLKKDYLLFYLDTKYSSEIFISNLLLDDSKNNRNKSIFNICSYLLFGLV